MGCHLHELFLRRPEAVVVFRGKTVSHTGPDRSAVWVMHRVYVREKLRFFPLLCRIRKGWKLTTVPTLYWHRDIPIVFYEDRAEDVARAYIHQRVNKSRG